MSQGIRAYIRRPGWGSSLQAIASLTPDELLQAAEALGKTKGTLDDVINAPRETAVTRKLRNVLESLRTASGSAPGTAGSRRAIHHRITGYRLLFGPNLVWCTININAENPVLGVFFEGPDSEIDLRAEVPDLRNFVKMKEEFNGQGFAH